MAPGGAEGVVLAAPTAVIASWTLRTFPDVRAHPVCPAPCKVDGLSQALRFMGAHLTPFASQNLRLHHKELPLAERQDPSGRWVARTLGGIRWHWTRR
jgi:hypothetical protein